MLVVESSVFVCVGLFFACGLGLVVFCLLVYEWFWLFLFCFVFVCSRVRGLFVLFVCVCSFLFVARLWLFFCVRVSFVCIYVW